MTNIMHNRRMGWASVTLPSLQVKRAVIKTEELQLIWALNEKAIGRDGRILDARLLSDLAAFYIIYNHGDRYALELINNLFF